MFGLITGPMRLGMRAAKATGRAAGMFGRGMYRYGVKPVAKTTINLGMKGADALAGHIVKDPAAAALEAAALGSMYNVGSKSYNNWMNRNEFSRYRYF